jgi:L-aminopeptidase/D-esterase-like protein
MILGGSHVIGVGSHSVLLAPLLSQGGALEAFGQEPRADGATAPKEAGEVRARDLGIPFHGTPGPFNAITDVPGVEVGQVTLISGEGKLRPGEGPVRTGVTAILPRGRTSDAPVFAGWFTLNGFGELTGTTFVEETGFLLGPVMITGTHSMGVVRDATNEWYRRQFEDPVGILPVVGETWPGTLSDVAGFHVRRADVFAALDGAASGSVAEGNVGGGTPMVCHGFKGGIGSSSRVVRAGSGEYTVGVLVQCNYGSRRLLRIAGVPVGEELPQLGWCLQLDGEPTLPWKRHLPRCGEVEGGPGSRSGSRGSEVGTPNGPAAAGKPKSSIIVVIGTDAPLLPHQLKRLAKRAAIGIARVGGLGGNTSGDIFIAFSTASRGVEELGIAFLGPPPPDVIGVDMLADPFIDPIYEGTVDSTEEAIVNALVAAETMTGADGVTIPELPHDQLREILKQYGR